MLQHPKNQTSVSLLPSHYDIEHDTRNRLYNGCHVTDFYDTDP